MSDNTLAAVLSVASLVVLAVAAVIAERCSRRRIRSARAHEVTDGQVRYVAARHYEEDQR